MEDKKELKFELERLKFALAATITDYCGDNNLCYILETTPIKRIKIASDTEKTGYTTRLLVSFDIIMGGDAAQLMNSIYDTKLNTSFKGICSIKIMIKPSMKNKIGILIILKTH